jgi:hypothetical protein
MKKLFVIFLFFLIKKSSAQTWVTIPDTNFVSYLQNIIPNAMNGHQLDVTNTLVTNRYGINVGNLNISSLVGIQYFTSLKLLYCNNNSLNNLPPLPNKLQALECFSNFFINLPTLPDSLRTLKCYDNKIINLPSLPISLTYLNCGNNPLINLPVLPNALTYLSCRYDSLTSLPALPDSLTFLDCSYNNLTTLPSLPNSINQLYCHNNKINCFPVFPNSIWQPYSPMQNSWVYYFEIYSNPFVCLPNHIPAMDSTDLATPLCTAGNFYNCNTSSLQHINDKNNQISIYPNPNNGNFIIETNAIEIQMLQIFDIAGKTALCQNINGKTNINVNSLDNGIYFIQVKTSENVSITKIIVQH